LEEARRWLRIGVFLILLAVVLAAVPLSALGWASGLAWERQGPYVQGSALLCPRPSPPNVTLTACPPGFHTGIGEESCCQHAIGEFRLDWHITVLEYAGQHVYFVLGYPAALGIALDARNNRTGLNPVYLSVEMPPAPNGSLVAGTVYFNGESLGDNASFFLEFQDRDIQSTNYTTENRTLAVHYQLDNYYRPTLDSLLGTWSGNLFLALYLMAGASCTAGILSIARSRRLRGAPQTDAPHESPR